jgi:hypothetical protein
MSKKLQLTIPKPCHENWDGMTPVEKGKFCGSCQKQVVDFSNMSDRQVAEFFKKPSTGSVCGRFMTDQLDRTIEIPKKRIPWVKYFFQFAIPAFLVSIKASAQKTQGKIKMNTVANDTTKTRVDKELITLGLVALPENLKSFKENKEINNQPKKPVEVLKGDIKVSVDTAIAPAKDPTCSREIMGKVSMPVPINKNEIEGRVVDEKGEPVPFASIETGKPGQGIIADENGIFRIKKNWITKSGLVVSSAGFESKRVIEGEEEYSSGKLYVQLKANVVLPDVVLTAIDSRRVVGMVMGSYSVVRWSWGLPEIKRAPVDNTVIIYPNPVKSGTMLNLSFKKPDEGYYHLQILNQSGQAVQQKEIWIDAEARLLNIDVPAVPAGSYFLVLTNKKSGKKFTEKIIIQ